LSTCVLDTDVIIAVLDRADAHHRQAARAIEAMLDREEILLVSTINYAEALVRPAEDQATLRAAVDAIGALGIKPVAPGAAVARDAARFRALNVSLADGFAMATAQARSATVASFDRRVRRAARELGLELPEPLAR
jgi:predicted nucleic acid-binding protein